VFGLHQLRQLGAEEFDLLRVEDPDLRQVAVSPKESDLIGAEPILFPFLFGLRPAEEVADRFMAGGVIECGGHKRERGGRGEPLIGTNERNNNEEEEGKPLMAAKGRVE
jgi:hypothetical protein